MDRFGLGCGRCLTALALAMATLSTCGCVNALATAWWVASGTDSPAEFKGLAGKRVAVVCRPPASMVYSTASASKDLAGEVGRFLKQNIKKMELVDPKDIAKWTDANDWQNPTEIGEAVDADLVVSIELDEFKLYEGQTLYRGKANVAIKVYDLKKNNEVVYEVIPPQTIYPVTTGVPTTDRQEAQFRREFVRVLADEISRRFYAHDSKAYFAPDGAAFH